MRAIILKHVQPTRIYVFGSRVTGEAKAGSDYDFAFDAQGGSTSALQAIREEIDHLHTLYRIDVTNIADADSRFANRVRDTGVVIYSSTKELRAQDGLMYFDRALTRFRRVVIERARWIAEGNGDIVLDVAAKRFEFTYEMAWKALKRVLDYLGIDARSPRAVFKEGYAQGLLKDEQVWLDMIEMRNLSSHVYDQHEISRILVELERYLAAFDALLERLRNILPKDSGAK
ncbi:MAG: HI0074 family nucleotidyltransferase substrate-binding subunit [Rhodocyclaceae bacterium]|nr:HI0074 family nucleotidyltransferase substrate-binding subunit [Rhodocyclaceae bacterium]